MERCGWCFSANANYECWPKLTASALTDALFVSRMRPVESAAKEPTPEPVCRVASQSDLAAHMLQATAPDVVGH